MKRFLWTWPQPIKQGAIDAAMRGLRVAPPAAFSLEPVHIGDSVTNLTSGYITTLKTKLELA
ncbi:hypothetical protein Ga0074115_12029 [endosymbiont of Ridgeia piscesae]|jgi:hypothetical protein|uniref:Uncharacterized protein n=1 Tax=endosymbiont of Ridgeia piscesae TaxID=54398 RepID=A0A0T5YYJ9_9GAMM|nr:hypothetical protein Ga0074115_12029 [endosymbiont of Ridgeia piscesae]KRT57377.1 hypothetical protein Ga0076813_113526 [endosymbiont of Ridgeia piscesae]